MKKNGIVNAPLNAGIAELGHTDLVLVTDIGFPIPRDANRVDLAITDNLPTLQQVLELLSDEIFVEGVVRAEQIPSNHPDLEQFLQATFKGAEFSVETHEAMLSEMAKKAKLIIRTGGYEPWGNIGLICGVNAAKFFSNPNVTVPDSYKQQISNTKEQ